MLVACGVMAHADGVLDGQECDRLLAMVEDEADSDDDGAWLSTIGDRDRLEEMLEALPALPEEHHRDVLENAWLLAVVDGERTAPELAALESLAKRLGVEQMQLEFWREAWTTQQHDLAELAVVSACVVLGGTAPVTANDRSLIRDLAWRLPATDPHRERLEATSAIAHDPQEVARRLRAISKRKRRWVLCALASVPRAAGRREDAIARARALGIDAGLSEAVVDAALG